MIYASVPVAGGEMVDRAVENAWQAFRTSGWARMAPFVMGEEAAAKYADSLSRRIRNGEFTIEIARQ